MSASGREDSSGAHSGPVFRLASVSKNLSIAPPLRLPLPARSCRNTHLENSSSSSSSSSSGNNSSQSSSPRAKPKSSQPKKSQHTQSVKNNKSGQSLPKKNAVPKFVSYVTPPGQQRIPIIAVKKTVKTARPTQARTSDVAKKGVSNIQSRVSEGARKGGGSSVPSPQSLVKKLPNNVKANEPIPNKHHITGVSTRSGTCALNDRAFLQPRASGIATRASSGGNGTVPKYQMRAFPRAMVNSLTKPTSISPTASSSNSSQRSSSVSTASKCDSNTSPAVCKRHASEMKPKVSTRSSSTGNGCRAKVKIEDVAVADPEEFWKNQDTNHWRKLGLKDLLLLRSLQQEQYEGYQFFISNNSDHHGLCVNHRHRLPVPPPVEATKTVSLPSSINYELASRGSADEVFWTSMISSTQALLPSVIDNKAMEKTVQAPQPNEKSKVDGVSISTKCVMQNTLDTLRVGHSEALASVTRNHTSFNQNEYMYPKPVPIFGHLQNSLGDQDTTEEHVVTSKDPAESTITDIYDTCSILGKRGRLYDETWDEEDFLLKKLNLIEECNESSYIIPFRTKVVDNWNWILNNYSDDHDGVYLDWLLDKRHEKYQERKNDEIFYTTREESRMKNSNISDEEYKVTTCFSPPVPVSCHHPAAWGLFHRKRGSVPSSSWVDPSMGLGLGKKRKRPCKQSEIDSTVDRCLEINSSSWHPAANTSHTTLPVSACRYVGDRAKSDNLNAPEDFDDLSVHLDMLLNQLALQSSLNFVALSNLTSAVGNELNLQALRCQHSRLESSSVKLCDYFAKAEKELRNAVTKASVQKHMSSTDDCSSFGTRSKDITPFECKTLIKSKIFQLKRTKHLDKCRDVKENFNTNSKQLAQLVPPPSVGDLLEVYNDSPELNVEYQTGGKRGFWSLSTVINCKTDANGKLRLVQAVESCASDAEWVSIDDNLLAPPGTNVPLFIVERARRNNMVKLNGKYE